jgi:hypothetical protein
MVHCSTARVKKMMEPWFKEISYLKRGKSPVKGMVSVKIWSRASCFAPRHHRGCGRCARAVAARQTAGLRSPTGNRGAGRPSSACFKFPTCGRGLKEEGLLSPFFREQGMGMAGFKLSQWALKNKQNAHFFQRGVVAG